MSSALSPTPTVDPVAQADAIHLVSPSFLKAVQGFMVAKTIFVPSTPAPAITATLVVAHTDQYMVI